MAETGQPQGYDNTGQTLVQHLRSATVHEVGAVEGATDSSRSVMYAAARLYYIHDHSQDEIGRQLQVSRSTVSRLLQRARDLGIVQITVRAPSGPGAMASTLTERLGLAHVRVIDPASQLAAPSAFAGPVGDLLAALGLGRGSVFALSRGRTVWSVVRAGLPQLPGVVVVPTIGGLDEPQPYYQANEIARLAAVTCDGQLRLVHAPALPSSRLREALLAEPRVQSTLGLWDRIHVALVGIGAPPRVTGDYGPLFDDSDHHHELDVATGDVCSRYFDLDGGAVAPTVEDRVLAVSRDQLQRAGMVIAVAVGAVKAASIIGAARSGLIDVLVTETTTAKAVLDLLEERDVPPPAAGESVG